MTRPNPVSHATDVRESPLPLPVGGTRRTLVDLLHRHPDATVGDLAARVDISTNAVRQHLDGLEAAGLVERRQLGAAGPGRPPLAWRLTDAARSLFPDAHAELAVGLLLAVADSLGDGALDSVVAARVDHQEASYRAAMPSSGSLPVLVEALAARRTEEGYEAEVVVDEQPPGDPTSGDPSSDDPPAVLLMDRHCPISAAAHACAGLCGGELELFRRILGPDVEVTRTRHLLAGDQVCAYRIAQREPAPAT